MKKEALQLKIGQWTKWTKYKWQTHVWKKKYVLRVINPHRGINKIHNQLSLHSKQKAIKQKSQKQQILLILQRNGGPDILLVVLKNVADMMENGTQLPY